jgi:lipoate-protein ligase A
MKQDKWRLLRIREDKGAMQMAIDEAVLLARAKDIVPNTLRFFTWKPPALTIGYFQSLKQEIDISNAERLGIDIVRRYTGGGAVFHDAELTYSLVVPEDEISFDIIESYNILCKGIINGLAYFGIEAEFRPINDIITRGKKISGNAQTRKKGIILQHGTILLDVDVRTMFSLLKVSSEKIKDKMIKKVEERVTSLKDESGRIITAEKVEEAMIKGFEQALNIKLIEGKLSDKELEIARKLYEEKYSTKEWNYLR